MSDWKKIAKDEWLQGMEPDMLDEWPAAELFASIGNLHPTTKDRWRQAGGKFYGETERMIALKTDPVWVRFSKYGRAWPPYDNLAHALRVRDIASDEAAGLNFDLTGIPVLPPAKLAVSPSASTGADYPLREPSNTGGVALALVVVVVLGVAAYFVFAR